MSSHNLDKNDGPPSKVAKMETNGKDASIHDSLSHLGPFTFKRVLSESTERKVVYVEASVKDSDDPAVLIIEKLPFSEDIVKGVLNEKSSVEQEFSNDIYGQYRVNPDPLYNLVKANVVHPATHKHIAKYLSSPAHLVLETPQLYRAVTIPFLEKEQFTLDWVYNVLEHKKEVERIIYEDPDPDTGFIITPDFKWSGKQVEDLYCLAIVHKRGIKSLRDLNASHLPLLKNVLSGSLKAIKEKYGLAASKVRAYLHYQPSYYHLHVHFTNVEYAAPGINTEKSHLLNTVISNIERDGSYYKKADLTFLVREKDKLYLSFKQFGYFDKLPYNQYDESEEIVPSVMDFEFEGKDEAEKTIKFLEMIGQAKHEPSGEHWEATYGESAWRMAVMCMCLPQNLNRRHLMNLTLVSSLASLGTSNDENTEWKEKIAEVKSLVRQNLPPASAGLLCELFEEHAAVRRNQQDGSEEHRVYRGVLELEEMVLRFEEAVKEGIPDTETKGMTKGILAKMASVGFPGASRVKLFQDYGELVKLLAFWLEISKLLRLKRTGWVRCKVREPETVASHMYRMGVMGMLLSTQRSEVEEGDAAVVSICHDMAECLVGDITPHDKVSDEEKHKAEMDAMQKLVKDLPDFMCRDFFSSFKRYEDQKAGDIDAILTKDFDKFDMILQAFEYEKREKKGKFLQQFFDSTMDVFKSVPVKKWQKVLLEIRDKHFSETNPN